MFRKQLIGLLAIGLFLSTAVPAAADRGDRHEDNGQTFRQTNLVSDIPGMAKVTDAHLVNPWGIATGPTTPFWISDNNAGVATVYDKDGNTRKTPVNIPPPTGAPGTQGTPTGVVFNGTPDFVVHAEGKSGTAAFIFATEDGTIAAWNNTVDPNNAILVVDNPNTSTGAVYKGLALASSAGKNFLYAANFRDARVDVFDATVQPARLDGNFSDPRIPAGFAPFGIQAIGNRIFVTYAKQNAEKHDDVAGRGNGFVDVFSTNGRLLRRFAERGALNSPWGVAVAPDPFGRFGDEILVGNFGDGRINVFDAEGEFRGQLRNETHQPLTIPGLWGLRVGNGGLGGDANAVYFTAGINDEQHGLFGSLTPVDDD